MNYPTPDVCNQSESPESGGQYIEHHPGNLNIILCAPHGGLLRPESIPDRDAGSVINGKVTFDHSSSAKDFDNLQVRTLSDRNTIDLALLVSKEIEESVGKRPHVIINKLYRGKMDANCDIEKATFNIPEAQEAWKRFHQCVDEAKKKINGPGLFLDIHGQSQAAWVELGYTVSSQALDTGEFLISSSSVSALAKRHGLTSNDLIYGDKSLGSFLEEGGYHTVPSPKNPSPKGEHYYPGGYNTIRHGSKYGGDMDSIQIECPHEPRRSRALPHFSKALAHAIIQFWREYYSV